MPTISKNASTTTQITIDLSSLAADGTLEIQYAARADFELCVAPILEGIANSSPQSIGGLNPGSTYYIRARSKRLDGTIEDWSNTIAVRTADGAAWDTSPASILITPAMLIVPEPVLSWSSPDTVAGFDPANLAHDGPTAWRSQPGAGTVHEFTAELGDVPIDTIALLMSNAAHDATVTVTAGATTAASDFTFGPVSFRASANLPGRRGYHALIQLSGQETHRYWKVSIDSANSPALFHLEHAIFGVNRSSKNHALEKVEAPSDQGVLSRTRSGNPVRQTGARMRRVDFDLYAMSEAKYEGLYADLYHRSGNTEPVLCVPNSKDGSFLHDRILYGAITGGRVNNIASPFYTRTFTIDSII